MKWQIARLFLNIRKGQLQQGIDSENVNRYAQLYTIIQAVTQSGIKPGADSSLAMAELPAPGRAITTSTGRFANSMKNWVIIPASILTSPW